MRLLVIVDTYVPARISGADLRRAADARTVQGAGGARTRADRDRACTGASEPWSIEWLEGVEVLRVRTPHTKDVGMLRRALAECWLPFSMLRRLARSPLRLMRWDGVVWYSPSIFLGPMVRCVKRASGCRGYLILRDLFPDWAVDAGVMRKGRAYRCLKWVERSSTGRQT